MNETISTMGQRIRDRLWEMRRTQNWLAKETGIDRRQICGYVNGKNAMSADRVAKIAKALICSADWLLGLSEERGRY